MEKTGGRPGLSLHGKVVVITGASGGIGLAAATEFAKRGARLALVARRRQKLEDAAGGLCARFGDGAAIALDCDVSDRSQAESTCGRILDVFGRVDILVNNAGFAVYGPVSDASIDDIESQMRTNYLGMVYCTKTLLPDLLRRGSGHIVNVASVAASFGLPGIAPYCASKFAMLGFSEGLKHELYKTGVGVTVVSPIMVRTEFFDGPSFEGMPKDAALSLDPRTVAAAIIRASSSPRLEIMVPSVVRGAVWLKHTAPYAINPLMGRLFTRNLEKTADRRRPV